MSAESVTIDGDHDYQYDVYMRVDGLIGVRFTQGGTKISEFTCLPSEVEPITSAMIKVSKEQ